MVEHADMTPWLRQTTKTRSVQFIDQTTTKTVTVERRRWWGWERLEDVDRIVGPGDGGDTFIGHVTGGGFVEFGRTGSPRRTEWKPSPRSPSGSPSILEPQGYVSLADVQVRCLERNGPGWHADAYRDHDDPPGMVKDGPKRRAWGCTLNGVTPGLPTRLTPEDQAPLQLSREECDAVARWFASKAATTQVASSRETARRQGCELPARD